jgi:hypothetical protein
MSDDISMITSLGMDFPFFFPWFILRIFFLGIAFVFKGTLTEVFSNHGVYRWLSRESNHSLTNSHNKLAACKKKD